MKSFQQIYESANQNNKNKFVRYGRIDPYAIQNSNVYNPKENLDGEVKISFHTAPAKKGFYAMPYDREERFLVGALNVTQPDLFDVEIEEFQYGMTEKEHEAFNRRTNKARKELMRKNRHIFTLKNDDLIWHHLIKETPKNEIEQRKEYWALTTVKAYETAKRKSYQRLKAQSSFKEKDDYIKQIEEWETEKAAWHEKTKYFDTETFSYKSPPFKKECPIGDLPRNKYSFSLSDYDWDSYEVFIDPIYCKTKI